MLSSSFVVTHVILYKLILSHTKVFLPLDSKSSKNATDVVKEGHFPSLEDLETSEIGYECTPLKMSLEWRREHFATDD